MASGEGTAITGVAAIGKYFVVVSLVPSTTFAAYLLFLMRSRTAKGTIDLARAFQTLDLKSLTSIATVSLVLALTLHPLQFVFIQTLEGYWGSSGIGRWLALTAILRHRKRAGRLQRQLMHLLQESRPIPRGEPYPRHPHATPEQVDALWTGREARRLYSGYPYRLEDVMPTRLGNVLRHYESFAGSMYGIDAITMVPRLLQVADRRDVEYVQNQRTQLELAVRTCVLGLLATAVTFAVMFQHGWYLILALVPYGVAFLSYRGAVAIAHEYGTALSVLIELNRFTLYERLRIRPPSDLARERIIAAQVTEMLRLETFESEKRITDARLRYTRPATQPAPSKAESTQGDEKAAS